MQNYLLKNNTLQLIFTMMKHEILKSALTNTQRHVMRGIDMLLPPRCPVTGEIVEVQGIISPSAWSKLSFISDPFCQKCGIPFEFQYDKDQGEGNCCMACLERPPPYDSARSALIYDEVSRDLILGFKHGDKLHSVQSFIPWLSRAGQEMLEQADFLIPVPLHPSRLRARRYNQASIISYALSKKTGVPTKPLVLRRTRATKSQGHLTSSERSKNVKKAFEVSKDHQEMLKNKSVILIDDVYTTGATVKECAKELKKHNVANVSILTIARVVKD